MGAVVLPCVQAVRPMAETAARITAVCVKCFLIINLLLILSYLHFTLNARVYYFFSLNITGRILELFRRCGTTG